MRKILLSLILCVPFLQMDAQNLSNQSSLNDLLQKVESLGTKSGSVYDYFTQSEINQLRNYYQTQNAMSIHLGGHSYVADGINATTLAYGAETAAFNKFVSFDITNPAVLTQINNTSGTTNFEGAGAIDPSNPSVGYAMNIIGQFYQIDVATGTYTLIGSSGVANINGMEFNPVNGTLYANSSTALYTINKTTGAATLVGNLNNSGALAVALAIDGAGNAYTYDLVDDALYSVNLSTGNATMIGSIGFDANYGQGMAWDEESNTIYMTAFNNSTFLAELRSVNTTTGSTTFLGNINGSTLSQVAWVSFVTDGGGTAGNCDLEGDTTGGPIWDRPLQDGSGMSSVGEGVTYHVYGPFTVDTAGSYTFHSAQSGGWDGMIFVYQNAFDPENPLTNYLAGNDDFGGIGNSEVSPTLAVGTEYFFITTGFDPGDFGTFVTTITGPGTVTCDGGIDPPSDYCGPISFEYTVEPITHVIFSNIDNESSSSTSSPEHEDFTDLVANVNAGETYELRVEGNTDGNWQNYITAFIDWNQNGILNDAGEVYEVGTITNSNGNDAVFAALNILIPDTALVGQTRMRIFKVYDIPLDYNLDPCAMDQNFGQVEDYTLNVSSDGGEDPVYCEPELDCTDGDLITNVTFQEINNPSDCSPNGYGNYTSMIATVAAGESYPIDVTVGSGWAFESVSVWIDYDNNGTFDEDEFTYVGTGSGSVVSGNIAIPGGVADGQYRMRVRVAAVGEGSATWDMACDESQVYGETEDYTVQVGEGSGGGEACSVEYVGTVQDGIGNLQTLQIANDFPVAAETEMLVSKVTLKLFADISTASLYFYEDNGGMPGALVDQALNVTPTSKTFISNTFGFNVYEMVFDLPTQISLESGTSETIFWVGLTTLAGSEGGSNYWEAADANTNGVAMVSTDGGATWVANSFGQDSAFKVEGECQTLGMPEMSSFDFAYYPNPARDILNITSQKSIQSVDVFNLAGQQVMQTSKVANGQVNVQMLPSGTYVFRVSLEGGAVETFKIIKK